MKHEHCDQCGIFCPCEVCYDEDDWEEVLTLAEWIKGEEEEDEEPRSDPV